MIERLGQMKPCKWCSSTWHTGMSCPTRRKPMNRGTSQLTTTKPMNKTGRVAKKTASYVAKWKLTQKPNHQGFYTCYISGRQVPYLIAEHPYSKVRHPELRTNQKLEPVCAEINKLKGSMDISDFLEKYPEYKATVKPEYL